MTDLNTQAAINIEEKVLDSLAKEMLPYWNEELKEISQQLWLPIKDFHSLDLSLSKGLLLNIAKKSWFSTEILSPKEENNEKFYSPLSQYSLAQYTDLSLKELKTRKIRIYPSTEQKKLIRKWAGVARYLYNKTIEYLKQPNTTANWKKIKTDLINAAPDWTKDVPYQIKSIAIKDACTAVSNAKIKYKQTKQIQEVKFHSCREKRDSVYIPKSAVLKLRSVYHTITGESLNPKELFPVAEFDCRLLVDHSKYYLIIPVSSKGEQKYKQHLFLQQIVALDPGVRTFQTFYSSNIAGKFGAKDFGRIHRLCSHLDRLVSKITKAKNAKQRYSMRKAAARIRENIKNLIAEIHWKTARFLCTHFKVILLPKFETSQMVSNLASKTARAMLTWSHYAFKERLKHKAKEFGVKVLDVSEEYTSKTCSSCGHINKIGSKSIIKCKCGLNIDRDLNGARGIFLKNLSLALGDTPFPVTTLLGLHLLTTGNIG